MAGETTLAESAQAIFCSAADYLGQSQSKNILNITRYPTFKKFKDSQPKLLETALDRVDVDVPTKDVYAFLDKRIDWYKSSLLIANKVVSDLHTIDRDFSIKSKGFNDGKMFYLRGDKDVMGTIGAIFKIANKSLTTQLVKEEIPGVFGFTDINKWSPADIYFANPTAKEVLKKELSKAESKSSSYDITDLNNCITKLINGGNLLPLSLKKTSSTVQLKKVNWSEDIKSKFLRDIKFKNVSDWKKYSRLDKNERKSWAKFKKGGKTETRDIKLYSTLEGGVGGEIKIRHDPSGSSGRFVCEFTGSEARGGSLASQILFAKIWSTVDKSTANKFLSEYDKSNTKFLIRKKELEELKEELRSNKHPARKNVTEYDHYMANASAELLTNNTMPIIKKWFSDPRNDRNKFIRLMFQVVTSRSPLSAKFVIAKG